jgi:hypothetical protein
MLGLFGNFTLVEASIYGRIDGYQAFLNKRSQNTLNLPIK